MEVIKRIVSAIKSEPAKTVAMIGSDAAVEALVDKDGPLAIVPFGTSAVAIMKLFGTYRDHRLLEKINDFLDEISDLTWSERSRVVDELAGDASKEEKVGRLIMDTIDRCDEDDKPRLIGKLFVAVGRGELEASNFLRLSRVINRAEVDDLRSLATSDGLSGVDEERKYALQAVGLARWETQTPESNTNAYESTYDLARILLDSAPEIKWSITSDARMIVKHCFSEH